MYDNGLTGFDFIVGENNDLFHTTLIADNINLLVNDINGELYGKVRSRGELTPCTATIKDNKLIVTFKRPIRAITKGQSVVLYKGNILLGGGIDKNGKLPGNVLLRTDKAAEFLLSPEVVSLEVVSFSLIAIPVCSTSGIWESPLSVSTLLIELVSCFGINVVSAVSVG